VRSYRPSQGAGSKVNLEAESRISEGAHANLWLDPTRMHLFDPATGDNLTHGHGAEARTLASA
jgi:multiple sugar transport system ATP-binding protein